MLKSLITKPTLEPVSLDEAKEHLIVEHVEDDYRIYQLIVAARQHLEARCDRVLVRQKWRLYMPGFSAFKLEPYKVQEVEQIQYTDIDGATQTLSSSVYTVDIPAQEVYTAYNQVWPQARNVDNAVWADVWSGEYELNSPIDVVSGIPEDIKSVILFLVADLYENRGKSSEINLYKNETFDALIQPHIQYANR